jgi:hypothetical protein
MNGQKQREKIMPDRGRLLELALKGLQADRAKIDNEIAQIKNELNSRPTVAKSGEVGNPTTTQPRKRRRMSAAAKKKISEAMKRRYAEMKMAVKK